MTLLNKIHPLAPAILASLLFLPAAFAQEITDDQIEPETQPTNLSKPLTTSVVPEEAKVIQVTEAPKVNVSEPKTESEKALLSTSEPKVETSAEPVESPLTYSPNGEVRLRGSYRVLGIKTQSLTSRARVGLKANYENLSINLQIQDARTFGSTGVADGGLTGIHEGYFQLDGNSIWFRAGRQEISLGGQRMIGSLNWADAARAFDALRFQAQLDEVNVDLFGAIIANQNIVIDSNGDQLMGAYFTYALLKTITIEPYVLFRHHGPDEADPTKKHNIVSFGLRTTGSFESGIGYDLEGGLQIGKRNDNDHFAFAGAGEFFYKINATTTPKISLGFTLASGQSADGKTNEFDNFFPTNHKFYGSADLFGWRNIIQGHLKLSAKPADNIHVNLMIAPTLLFDKDGRWSNAGGKTIGAPSGEETFLGNEIDVNAKWTPKKHFFFSGGYSILLPGPAAEERLGSGDPLHYLYLMGGVNFKSL